MTSHEKRIMCVCKCMHDARTHTHTHTHIHTHTHTVAKFTNVKMSKTCLYHTYSKCILLSLTLSQHSHPPLQMEKFNIPNCTFTTRDFIIISIININGSFLCTSKIQKNQIIPFHWTYYMFHSGDEGQVHWCPQTVLFIMQMPNIIKV